MPTIPSARRSRRCCTRRELKDAYALGKIPTQDFADNEMFFQPVLLAYNLLNWFKRLCAPPAWQRSTLGRLRQRLLVVPAHLVRPGGEPTLRIAPGYVRGNCSASDACGPSPPSATAPPPQRPRNQMPTSVSRESDLFHAGFRLRLIPPPHREAPGIVPQTPRVISSGAPTGTVAATPPSSAAGRTRRSRRPPRNGPACRPAHRRVQ